MLFRSEQALFEHRGIVANPNCSTIQMMVALEPIRQKFGLEQIIVSTYQAASGAGQTALDEMLSEAKDYLAQPTKKINTKYAKIIK